MTDQSSRLPPPISRATRPNSLVAETRTPHSTSDVAISASGVALGALKDVLEATDSLPCIKYLAGVCLKILEIIDEMEATEKALRGIGMRARDIVLAVARACAQFKDELEVQLEDDVKQLTETMNEIFSFTEELASRSRYKKLFYRSQDAEAVKSLDMQLTHAFHIFEIQSSVHLRISQQLLVKQLENLPQATNSPPVFATTLLHVPEGLYMIRNADDGRVIESEHMLPSPNLLHAYAAPPTAKLSVYQLWVVYKKGGRDFKYTIRNFATGAALDVFVDANWRNHVICWGSHGEANQTWEFYGSRRTHSVDYCTIRSCGPRSVLDARCPAGDGCDYLHQTELAYEEATASQEWSLVRFPFDQSPPIRPSLIAPAAPPDNDVLPRRQYLLQNVASGGFMTSTPAGSKDVPNVTVVQDISAALGWHFIYGTENCEGIQHDALFAIATGAQSRLATLDHWGGQHIAASYGRFWPGNTFHMWKVVPRDGCFVFRNQATGAFLAQDGTRPDAQVVAAPPTAAESKRCQWRLVDAATGEVCRVLYESTMSIVPPELSGAAIPSSMSIPTPDAQRTLRPEAVSAALREQFLEHLRNDHDAMRDMLSMGYTALVVAPQLVRGGRNGRVHDMALREEEAVLRMRTLRGKGSFDKCEPK